LLVLRCNKPAGCSVFSTGKTPGRPYRRAGAFSIHPLVLPYRLKIPAEGIIRSGLLDT